MSDVMILVAKGDPEQKPRLYACPKCGSCHSPKIYACREEQAHEAAYQAAANCYNCREHNNCSECGIECDKHRIKCDACHKASVFAKAEKIDAAGVEHCFGWDGTFYHEVADAEDADEPWVFASTFTPFRIDPDSVIENVLDDHHEDASTHDLNGVDDLVAAIKAFNEAQTSGSYFEDRTRIAMISARSNIGEEDNG